MPDIPYSWTDTHVDIFLNNIENNNDVKIKRLTRFFKIIGVESLNIGLINKIFDECFNTIKKILNASIDDINPYQVSKKNLLQKYTQIYIM